MFPEPRDSSAVLLLISSGGKKNDGSPKPGFVRSVTCTPALLNIFTAFWGSPARNYNYKRWNQSDRKLFSFFIWLVMSEKVRQMILQHISALPLHVSPVATKEWTGAPEEVPRGTSSQIWLSFDMCKSFLFDYTKAEVLGRPCLSHIWLFSPATVAPWRLLTCRLINFILWTIKDFLKAQHPGN